MDERTVKKTFESLGPSDEARQRMLAHILSAQEESVPVPTIQPAQRRHQAVRFSPIRYVLPIAACLILAAITPLTLPHLVNSFEQSSPTVFSSAETASSNSATESESSNTTTLEETSPNASPSSSAQQDISQPDNTSKDHQGTSSDAEHGSIAPSQDNSSPSTTTDATVVTPSANSVVEAPSTNSVVEAPETMPAQTNNATSLVGVVIFLLPLIFCLAAFVIALTGVFSRRRIKRRNIASGYEDETQP